MGGVAGALILCCALMLAGCRRETRDLRTDPSRRSVFGVDQAESSNQPGGAIAGRPSITTAGPGITSSPYQGNAYAISEGGQLWNWYNCAGCHSNGGGGIGPAVNDRTWLYGGNPKQIFESIAKGRKNGMPAWGGRIPEYQIWQLVAYIRSLSGDQPRSATAARQDSLEIETMTIRELEDTK